MAVNNGYPKKIIEKLRRRITNKKLQKEKQEEEKEHKNGQISHFLAP